MKRNHPLKGLADKIGRLFVIGLGLIIGGFTGGKYYLIAIGIICIIMSGIGMWYVQKKGFDIDKDFE